MQCSRETGEYRTRCIYIYIYSTRAKVEIQSKKRRRLAQRGDQGSQPVSVVHKSSTLDPTCLHPPSHPPPSLWPGPPWPCCTHTRTQTGRNLVARAHRSLLLTFLSNFLSLSWLLHPPFPVSRPHHYASRPFICFPLSPCRSTLFLRATQKKREGGRHKGEAGHPRRFNMESRKHAVSRKRMAGNKDWDWSFVGWMKGELYMV